MTQSSFDLEALIRAFVLSLATGLLVGAIGYFVMRSREDWVRRKPVLIMGVVGLILLFSVGFYYFWPSRVVVPGLDGLAEAEG